MDPAVVVSAREREVLSLLGEHLTHEEIGRRLFISVRTVESHAASLRRKLGISDHRGLVRYAAQHVEVPARHGTVPVALTSFVGRDRELREVLSAIGDSRLVSVVGTGGAGKTRLAMAAAGAIADSRDVVWVDLVPIESRAGLEDALIAVSGAVLSGRLSQLDAVAAALRDRDAVLVLDNCEHLLDVVGLVAERLLLSCPQITVLVTSRARLAVSFERVVRLSGLSTEPDGDAVALFGQRAAAAGAAWAADAGVRDRVAAVCEAVGGLALAVELAAARLPSMGLDGVERALSNQRGLLASATRAAERHRSMEDALDWSVALLDQNTATVFRRIAVLVAPFDASAAAVAAFAPLGETDVVLALAQLADHSLLDVRVTGTRVHYRMLEPVRQYAMLHLTEQDQAVFDRHLAWCREQAELALADDSDDVSVAFADDARAALARAASTATPDAVAVAHLARALGLVLFRSGSLREAQERLEQAASFSPERDSARDLSDAAAVAQCRQRGEEALRLKLKAAERHDAAGDPDAYAIALAAASAFVGRFAGMFAATPVATGPDLLDRARERATGDLQTQAAITLAGCACHATDQWPSVADALSALEIARRHGDTVQQSAAMDSLTVALAAAGKMVEASRTAQERLALLDGRGWQPAVIAELCDALHMAVATSAGAGDLPYARTAAARNATLPIWRDRPDDAAEMLILPAALSGDWETAHAAAERFLRAWNLAGRLPKPGAAWYPAAAALAFGLSGDERYDQWRDITAIMRRAPAGVSWFGTGYGELFEAMVLLDRGAPQAALNVLLTGRDLGLGGIVFAQWLPAVTAEAAALCAAAGAGDRVACARTKAAGNPIAEAITGRAEAILARDPARLAEIAIRLEHAGSPYQAARTRRLQRGLAARPGS